MKFEQHLTRGGQTIHGFEEGEGGGTRGDNGRLKMQLINHICCTVCWAIHFVVDTQHIPIAMS